MQSSSVVQGSSVSGSWHVPLIQTNVPVQSLDNVQGVGFLHSPFVHVKSPLQSVEVVQGVGFWQEPDVQV